MRDEDELLPLHRAVRRVHVTCYFCGGEGCQVCGHSGWIEMGGAGVVDPASSRPSATTPRCGPGSRSASGRADRDAPPRLPRPARCSGRTTSASLRQF